MGAVVGAMVEEEILHDRHRGRQNIFLFVFKCFFVKCTFFVFYIKNSSTILVIQVIMEATIVDTTVDIMVDITVDIIGGIDVEFNQQSPILVCVVFHH